ncbi:MAG TPA: AMP-binding protein, partial [Candidatus Limnocylindrales bacterium]|nr:AMP-binding protein [Candidatus Limnocylindrales bacterium]
MRVNDYNSRVNSTVEGQAASELATLPAVIAAHAARTPEAIAIAAPGRPPLTYQALHAHVASTVAALNRMGIGRHDRLAVVLPDSAETATALMAVASCATAAPLNPAYRAAELEFYLADLRVSAVLLVAGSDAPARAAAEKLGLRIVERVPLGDAAAGLFALSGDVGGRVARTTRPAGPDDVALLLHTSGSTARPKRVPILHRTLCARGRDHQRALRLDAGDRCLNAMPLFHASGLTSALMASLVAGAAVIYPSGFTAARFFGWMDEGRPTWIAGNPAMYQAVLTRAPAHTDVIGRRPLRLLRSGSASTSPSLVAELQRVFGAPVVQGYSATEVAPITVTPLPPRPAKTGSVGVGVSCEIAITDEEGRRLPIGETGEILVRGETVFHGYDEDVEGDALAFREGWYRTGDLGHLDADGDLFIVGRLKELINRGGEKILPSEVEAALGAHPDVAEAVVFAVPDPRLGEDVAAAIVLRPGRRPTARQLRDFVAARLADFKVPREMVFVGRIPKTDMGKPQRTGLAEDLGLTGAERRPAAPAPFVPARTELEATLVRIATEVLDVPRVGIHDDFFALGGDSLLAVQLMGRIREATGVRLSATRLFEAPTVAGLALALRRREDGSVAPSSLVAIQPRGSAPPVFAVGGVGGLAAPYVALARLLGDDQPFYGLEPRGLDGAAPPLTDLGAIAAGFVEELRAQASGPYFLLGACWGGVVVFEMAQQLLARG